MMQAPHQSEPVNSIIKSFFCSAACFLAASISVIHPSAAKQGATQAATTIGRICLIISTIQYCRIGQPASIPCSIIFRKSPKGCVFRREVRIRPMPEKLMPHRKTVSLLKQIGSCLSACFHLCTEPIMNTVLIIGAGGVGHVVANKCAQLPDIFQNIHLASRTKSNSK